MPLGEIYSASPTELHHLYSPYPSKLQAFGAAHYQICLNKFCSPVPQLQQIINSCNTTIYYQSMYFNPPFPHTPQNKYLNLNTFLFVSPLSFNLLCGSGKF